MKMIHAIQHMDERDVYLFITFLFLTCFFQMAEIETKKLYWTLLCFISASGLIFQTLKALHSAYEVADENKVAVKRLDKQQSLTHIRQLVANQLHVEKEQVVLEKETQIEYVAKTEKGNYLVELSKDNDKIDAIIKMKG
ncbi:hypothetical protein CN398_09810 [Bacillus thuringiensis]|uniref:Uncharacterized protein n=2 Tax=Bacillus thuringiensis TaxID=1428 RepID=A0A9X6VCI6_BACTU|nr:hypothetical protein CN398_09810 [Bacillus thuringiensis]